MDFYAVLDQVLALLRQRGRVSYRALKRQFDLDDAYLDDLKVEIIEVHQCAVDQEGTMLVWMGKAASAATPEPVQAPAPLTYTPPYLAEKIFTSRSALEGERKQVTVLFADLKGSLELILADRDPEEARQLLDPVLERMMAAVHRYEGTVNQVMGDGIMALFGAPIAHEDHTVRACYAALAMQEAVHHYAAEVQRSHGVPLQMRVGHGETLLTCPPHPNLPPPGGKENTRDMHCEKSPKLTTLAPTMTVCEAGKSPIEHSRGPMIPHPLAEHAFHRGDSIRP
jgi:hypothetical protein